VFDVKIYGERLETAMPLGEVDLVALAKEPDFVFELRVTQEDRSLFQKLATGRTLSDVCSCFQGFVTGGNEAYIVDAMEAAEQHLEKAILKPAVFGDEIKRYKKPTPKYRVIFLTRDSEISDFPNVKKRLEPFKKKLESKREVQNGRQPWYALHWARVKANYEIQPKILVQAIRNLSLKRRVVGTLDSSALYADHTLNVLIPKSGGMEMAVVLAFLNSKLVNYFFLKKYIDINIKGIYLEAIPLPISITNENVEEIKNASMELISLNEILETKNTPHEQESTSRRIEEAERHMDQLIYSSFGLSKDEIAIVENHV
jgi:adenine-specific DNA-methyltransferase